MKKYEADELIKNSRFVEFFPTLDKEMQENVKKRMNELVKLESIYCDKGNYEHISNMFTALSLYQEFIHIGKSEDEAYDIVSQTMWDYVSRTSAPKMKKLSNLKIFIPFMKKFMPSMFSKGSGYGWKYTWHSETDPKNVFSFDCNECIYASILKKYNALRLGGAFCHCDIINYGHLDHIDFMRTDTKCLTGQSCNFKFVGYKKNEKFERTNSI